MGSMSAADEARTAVIAKHMKAAFEELGAGPVTVEVFDAGCAVGVHCSQGVGLIRIPAELRAKKGAV